MAGYTVLQSVGAQNGAVGASATFGSNLSAGTKLIADCVIGGAGSTLTFADGSGHSFTALISSNTGFTRALFVFDTVASMVGTKPTLTVSGSGVGSGNAFVCAEVAGLAPGATTAACLDGTAGQASGAPAGSFTPTWGAYTSAAAGELLLAIYADGGDSGSTASPQGSPWTALTANQNGNSSSNALMLFKDSTGGTESATWGTTTDSGANNWATILVAFKLAPVPAVTMPARPLRRDRRARYRRWQWPAPPAGTVVTATQGGSTANGMLLRVKVLTGQAATQNGGTGTVSGSSAGQVSVTTTQAGSLVYGAAIRASSTAPSVNGVTAQIDGVSDVTHTAWYGTWESASVTGTPGATTFGYTATFLGSTAGAEILPSGTLAEDPSGPAGVSTLTDITVQTAPFNPPPGALLVAMVGADGGGAQTTMTVTGGGLTWTEVVKANTAGDGYAGVWTAVVPGGAGPSPGVAALAALFGITAPAVTQLAPATLLPAAAIAAPAAWQLAPATLTAAVAVNSPAVTQLAPATLAAAASVTETAIQQAVATLPAAAALSTAVTEIPAAGALGVAASLGSPADITQGPASLLVAGALAASGGGPTGATLSPGVALTTAAQQLAIAALGASAALTTAAQQLAPATLTVAAAVNTPLAVQLATALIQAQAQVTSPAAILKAPATLTAQVGIGSPAVRQLAVATLTAAASVGGPDTQLAVATLGVTAVISAGIGATGAATLTGGASLAAPAAVQLAGATLAAAGVLTAPAAREAATAILAALAAVLANDVQRPVATLPASVSVVASGRIVPKLVPGTAALGAAPQPGAVPGARSPGAEPGEGADTGARPGQGRTTAATTGAGSGGQALPGGTPQ